MKSVAYCLAALLLAGCSKNIDTAEAVKQGVIKDISKKVDVQNMELSVDSVAFRDKEALANVSFWPKGGDRSQSITMSYTMERKGDEWHVKDRNMQRHEQTPPGTRNGSSAQPLPPGHPPMEGKQLPPGHPPMTDTRKP